MNNAKVTTIESKVCSLPNNNLTPHAINVDKRTMIEIVLYGIILNTDTCKERDIMNINIITRNHKQNTDTTHIDATDPKMNTTQYSNRARSIKLAKYTTPYSLVLFKASNNG